MVKIVVHRKAPKNPLIGNASVYLQKKGNVKNVIAKMS